MFLGGVYQFSSVQNILHLHSSCIHAIQAQQIKVCRKRGCKGAIRRRAFEQRRATSILNNLTTQVPGAREKRDSPREKYTRKDAKNFVPGIEISNLS
jgi:hypothetical protein